MSKIKQLFFIVLSFGLLLYIFGCEREWSNPFDDKIKIDPEAWVPQNLHVEKISANELRLTWEYFGPENIEGFKIDRKEGNDAWVIDFSILPKNVRSWNDTDLPNQITFTYRIYAYAGNNKSLASTITEKSGITIGEFYKGGIIFYLDGTGSGLVCAESDQGTGALWGCHGTSIGNTGDDIGTGAANTAAIVAGCSETGIAARICNDLILNGYDDWFLPSFNELNLMYVNLSLKGIGGFSGGLYWSSSEFNALSAWITDFSLGYGYYGHDKYNLRRVRAVRAF